MRAQWMYYTGMSFEWARDIAFESWATLTEMAPYLLFGFLVAGLLSVLVSQQWVERHLGRRGIGSIIKASFFGVPLPLCSCGIIPVAASLKRHGAGKGATGAFLISTPQTGVDGIMVTLSLLGPVFAVFRALAAFFSGIFGGLVIERVSKSMEEDKAEECHDECCTPGSGRAKLTRILRYGFLILPADIARPLIAGLVIAGAITALVPAGFVPSAVGTGIGAMLVMLVLGIPIYVCATASVPIAAAMMAKGISPGAALVFLMTGPATNAATIATLWKILGNRAAVTYLLVVALSALAAGLLLNYLFVAGEIMPGAMHHELIPGYVKNISAFALLGVLILALVRGKEKGHD